MELSFGFTIPPFFYLSVNRVWEQQYQAKEAGLESEQSWDETLQLTLAEMLVHKELTRFGRPLFIVLNKLSMNFFFQICYSMITPWPLEEQKHVVHLAVVAAEPQKASKSISRNQKE